jgi:hypothetical protein
VVKRKEAILKSITEQGNEQALFAKIDKNFDLQN